MLEERRRTPRVIPAGSQGKMTCLFLILIPMAVILAVASVWVYTAKCDWDEAEQRAFHVKKQLLQIARLIINLNSEREHTTVYASARDADTIHDARQLLDRSCLDTDNTLLELEHWPGREHSEGFMYKSKIMFTTVLQTHRNKVTNGAYFRDEVQYYTDIIDIVYGWFMEEAQKYGNQPGETLSQYLLSYSYLLGSINYLGAEQALCSTFYSVICFSHRETFYYANYSLSGEAVFRLYRHSFPGVRDEGWKFQSHATFFPELAVCRTEILADMKYNGMTIDPSQCDYSRKNETILTDLDVLTERENGEILANISTVVSKHVISAKYDCVLKSILLGSLILYFSTVHVCRCFIVRCMQRRTKKKWKEKYMEMEQTEKFNHCNSVNQQTPTIIGFDDYSDCNCSTNYIKVATV